MQRYVVCILCSLGLVACSGSPAPMSDGSLPEDGGSDAERFDGDVEEDADAPDGNPGWFDADGGLLCDFDGDIERAFIVRTLKIASATVGSNLDDLDSSTTPNSIAGCRQADAAGGVDNVSPSLDSFLQGIPSTVGQQGVTSGTIGLTFTLSDWNGRVNDGCITLAMTGTGVVGATTMRTQLVSGVVEAKLPASSGWDITGVSGGASLTIPLRGVHAHLVLDQTLTELVLPTSPTRTSASFIAGHILYADRNASLSSEDFRPRIFPFMAQTGYNQTQSDYVDSIAAALRDLHTGGGLRPCMNPGANPNVVDADSFSAALVISTNPP